MELTTTVTCKTRVSATLEEDGTLSLKAFAEAEYAKGRTTTAEVSGDEIPAEEQAAVRAALKGALDKAVKVLGPRVAKAIHKSAEVAAAHGEI